MMNGLKTVVLGVIGSALFSATSSAAITKTVAGDGFLHLIYAPTTGDLTVQVNGNPYGTITLSATSSVFKNGTFGTSPEFYSDDNGDGTGLIFGLITGQQTADVTLPAVLDPNQAEATLLAAITVTNVSNGPAPSNISFSGGTTVPEPVSASMMALASVGLLARRRKA